MHILWTLGPLSPRTSPASVPWSVKGGVSGSRIVIDGFLLNILNPKLSIFFLAFLPRFLPVDSPTPTLAMLELGGIFMLLTFIVFVGHGAFSSATRRYVIAQPLVMRWLRVGFATVFGALALRLAGTQQ
jgi:threonine/homoserine/homoserine lactone efflux protein